MERNSGFQHMRMLYVGQSALNGLEKRRTLSDLGVDLVSFDTTPYSKIGPRLERSLAYRANLGRAVTQLNPDLVRFAETCEAITHVWVDKGNWIKAETIAAIRERFGAVAAHYSNDALFLQNRSRHFRRAIPEYDFVFTTKPWELEQYRLCGAQRLHVTHPGVHAARFELGEVSEEQRERFESDATFVGRHETHYARCVKVVARSGVRLRVWGPRWPRYARFHAWARAHVEGDALYDEYALALFSAKVCLGFLSKRFPETVTHRSFEIPAAGGFLLAERTPDHQELFEEGMEAEFFESDRELVEKIRHYVAHPEERDRIAAAGHKRFRESGYSSASRFRGMLEIVERGTRGD